MEPIDGMSQHDILALIIQMLMAIFGGAARVLNGKETQMRRARILSDLFVSAFTGILLYWVAQALNINASWMYALSGIAGWAGPHVIDGLASMVQSKTGIKLVDDGKAEETKSDEDGE